MNRSKRKMVTLSKRTSMAWKAFWCIPFEIAIEPYHDTGSLLPHNCDTSWRVGYTCDQQSEVCLSRTIATLTIEEEDHKHLCPRCASRISGRWEDSTKEKEQRPGSASVGE